MASVSIGEYCTISDDVDFGENVVVHGHANLYGCRIGDGSRIGTFVEIQRGATIGKRVRVQSHTFICSDIDIEDDVFVGHNVTFINDRYPSVAGAINKSWRSEGSRVRRLASIGSGAVIMCGIVIGEGAVVGAGTVVTRDVPPYAVVVGVPEKLVRFLSESERRARKCGLEVE